MANIANTITELIGKTPWAIAVWRSPPGRRCTPSARG